MVFAMEIEDTAGFRTEFRDGGERSHASNIAPGLTSGNHRSTIGERSPTPANLLMVALRQRCVVVENRIIPETLVEIITSLRAEHAGRRTR